MSFSDDQRERAERIKGYWVLAAKITGISTILLLVFILGVLPVLNVWRKEQVGKAALREAEQNRQIQVEEARANLESEKLNAQAEVERAKGAAQAIAIEDGQLTDRYIRYLFVRQTDLSNAQTIYIPTEAGLPILEAGRRP